MIIPDWRRQGTCSLPTTPHCLKNPKWRLEGSKTPDGVYPWFLVPPVNFRYIGFLIRALLLWQKYAAEKKRGGNKKSFIVASGPLNDWNANCSCQNTICMVLFNPTVLFSFDESSDEIPLDDSIWSTAKAYSCMKVSVVIWGNRAIEKWAKLLF